MADKDRRTINEQYAAIGARLIETEPILETIKESQATIVYLSSQHKKIESGKAVHAQCEKIQDKYKWGLPADFTITVFEPNCIGMTQEQLEILIFHELLHVKIDYKDGEEQYSINPHDLEDFRYIIDRFGSHWDEVKDPHEMNFSNLELKSVNMDDQIRQNLDHLNN